MPEQTTKLEPLLIEDYECLKCHRPIEAYRCLIPFCKQIIIGTMEKAKEHMNQPLDSPLPRGFVYKYSSGNGVFVVTNKVTDKRKTLDDYHSIVHLVRWVLPYLLADHTNFISSKRIKDGLKKGIYSLLTQEEEFEAFKEKFEKYVEHRRKLEWHSGIHDLKPEDLVRTTPELETLVEKKFTK